MRIALPDLLASRKGRLTAFFLLYVTEGIPLGFTATAIAAQMRRQGLGPADIGAFVGSLYLPWAFKWAVGPFVDVFSSDRFGRRSSLAVFAFLTVVPTLWLAYVMWQAGWIMPVDIKTPNRPHPSTVLVITFWATVIVYNIFQGLYYGIRTALYMDITNPAVAATQFTAYMALLNLCISYTAWWQGHAVERLGYPRTLVLDCVFGLSALLLLPLMRPRRAGLPSTETAATSPATA